MRNRGHKNPQGDKSALGRARSALARVALGFRYLLVLEDGQAADPTAFVTTIRSWEPGDEFLAGSDLRKFRIVAINTEDPPEEFNGVFIVESVESSEVAGRGHLHRPRGP
jgi:hypothetical protein